MLTNVKLPEQCAAVLHRKESCKLIVFSTWEGMRCILSHMIRLLVCILLCYMMLIHFANSSCAAGNTAIIKNTKEIALHDREVEQQTKQKKRCTCVKCTYVSRKADKILT